MVSHLNFDLEIECLQWGNIWCIQTRYRFQLNKLISWSKRVSVSTKGHPIFSLHLLGLRWLPIKLINNSIKFRSVFQSIKKAHIVVVELWMGIPFFKAFRSFPFNIFQNMEWKHFKWVKRQLKNVVPIGNCDWISSGLVSSHHHFNQRKIYFPLWMANRCIRLSNMNMAECWMSIQIHCDEFLLESHTNST